MESVIEQALIFIGSAVVIVPIFQRLGFGSVLGYLLAGVVVGPYGLGWIQDTHSIMHFSELGVVFLLFMIGLEIQPQKLWSMRSHLLGLGGLQILLCSLVFASLAWWAGYAWLAAGVVGFALSLSSTAFAVQSLQEKNLFNTEFGRASFSILLMQDLVAIPALAVIPLLAVANQPSASSLRFELILALGVGLVLASRFLIRPVFRLIAVTRSREIFTVVALFIVLGVGTLMQKVGLSAALGAFVAGVLLADSEYRHELEANLEPFKGLLMGLFFIAVGMGVSLDLIAQKPLVIFAYTILYLLVKSILIYSVGRLFRLAHTNAKSMALNISQGGEFAFVIFGMVAQLNLVASDSLNLLTVVITLSMAMSLCVSKIDDWYARFCQKRQVGRKFDEIKGETPEIIIAGFGRFGQIFGRLLRAQQIPFVAIDHDADQIELTRRFGNKVYYGDASRHDLLEAAGASKAKYLILAIDDVELSLKTAKMVKEHFPSLKIFARARNRGHAFDLMELGIQQIKRELFDSSFYFARDLLIDMGMAEGKAQKLMERFRRHDEIMLQEQFKVRTDDKNFVSVSQQAAAQLAQVLRDDEQQSRIL